jgi:hypothetical protein
MALVTVSEKRNRVYERKFDHDQARAMRKAGMSLTALAEHFGVSATSIQRACDPEFRKRMDKRTLKYMRERRVPCKTLGCETLVWTTHKDGSGYCQDCEIARRTAADERPGELRCTKCGEWKPDEDFRLRRTQTRRGRKSQCRACENATRNDYRRRHAFETALYDLNRKGRNTVHTYLILRRQAGDNGTPQWVELGEINAPSPAAAVEKLSPDEPGTYVAASSSNIVDLEQATVWRVVSRKART